MKKFASAFAICLSTAAFASCPQNSCSTQKAQVSAEAVQNSLDSHVTAEEQAFAASLNEQNRQAFLEKLSVEQRKAAMAVAKASTTPNAADEAVSKISNTLVALKEVPTEAAVK
jgi:hypothetical protein